MQLLPLDNPEFIDVAALWLSEDHNCQWLDFGGGLQRLSAVSLKIMIQKDTHLLRLFTPDDDGGWPIGIVGLSDINRHFSTATMWIVLGDKSHCGKGYPRRAVLQMLDVGFLEIGLNAIKVWAVECNHASLRIIKNLNFNFIGRERQAHCIGDHRYDRLWFDMLASEYDGGHHA